MADNTVIAAATGGDTIADDDITDAASVAFGAKVQRVKVGTGADGAYGDVTTANPLPVAQQGTATVAVSGTPNVAVTNTPNVAVTNTPAVTVTSGTVTADTELPAAAALVDAAANPTAPGVADYRMVFNGVNWDRTRSTAAANGTSGVGVPAAGIMGYDGTSYRPIKTDTTGLLQTAMSGVALSDGTGNPTNAGQVASYTLVWNGSTWDRLLNPVQANNNSTGHGLLASGMMAVNAAGQWQQARSNSNSGYGILVTPEYAEQTQGFNAAGQAMNISEARGASRLSVTFSGTWTATLKVQGSNDNTNWWDYTIYNATSGAWGTTIVANGLYTVPVGSRYVRIYVLAYTSGTPASQVEVLASPGAALGPVNWSSSGLFNGSTQSGTVKGSAGMFGGYYLYNPASTVTYMQFFTSTAGTVTFGTTVADFVIPLPPSSAANVEFSCGVSVPQKLVAAATTTPTGATLVTTSPVGLILYK